ncbi:MAG TPA: O-antigen ligase family protein [Rhizomicrobium sp.]|jgi:O-antigen ligase|nr:O-antigen ligase family protein [Rhizomicrobium sp.]
MSLHLRQRISSQLENAAYALLLAVVALAPLPFGSNGPESSLILSGMSGVVLLLASLAFVLDPGKIPPVRAPRLTLAMGCFALFGCWILVQIAPGVPQAIAHPLWAESSKILGVRSRATISIDPEMTWAALAKTGGYFAIGIASFVLLRDSARRQMACSVLAIAGGLYAIYGLIGLGTGDCCVVWQKKTAYFGVATGPFINRNSFATYLGLVALVCLGYILRDIGDLRRVSAASVAGRIAAKVHLLLARRWPMIGAFSAAVAALLLTLSRAGVTSSILAMVILLYLASQARVLGEKRRRFVHLAVFAGGLAGLLALFGGAFIGRIASNGMQDIDREQSWQIIVSGIEASPWLGHGFGTFPESFPLYRDDRLASRRYWDKAQDTYLELALDTGIPATAVFLLGFGALVLQCVKGLSRRRQERRIFPAIGLAAIALIGFHSIYDFSMQIPAVATIFAFIMAMAVTESGVWASSRPDRSRESA